MDPYQREILVAAEEMRQKEVIEYQVNIDNYVLAIEHIGDDADLAEFKNHLQSLLESSRKEQKKAQILLTVIQAQLAANPV